MATSARETFATRTADHTARIAKLRLTAPQQRDLRHIANGTNSNVTRAMLTRLSGLGLITHGAKLTDFGTAYVRTVKA